MKITRHAENPIVVPGLYDWRKVTVFNPAVIIDNGKFYMIERTAGSLTPAKLPGSAGKHGRRAFHARAGRTGRNAGPAGIPLRQHPGPANRQNRRHLYLNYALRPCAMNYYPTGAGIPERSIPEYPDGWGEEEGHWLTRSGILTSKDLIHWEYLCDTTPLDINDRDNILFPENQRQYVLLRRPEEYVGRHTEPKKPPCGSATPKTWCIGTSRSCWQKPRTTIGSLKIGGSTPPVRTDKGWLVLYHGVDQDTVYRVGLCCWIWRIPRKSSPEPADSLWSRRRIMKNSATRSRTSFSRQAMWSRTASSISITA